MKRYWYVLIEMYESGMVKANVIKNRLAESQPANFYKQEYGRETYGEWFGLETEAREIVAEAKTLSAIPVPHKAVA